MGDTQKDEGRAYQERIEQLLETPLWVVDVLPSRVPADGGGQFFAVEDELLTGLRPKFARVLLKLNCYHDLLVFRGACAEGVRNPKPKKLRSWLERDEEGLTVLLPAEDALISVPTDSTYMAVYNPTPECPIAHSPLLQARDRFISNLLHTYSYKYHPLRAFTG